MPKDERGRKPGKKQKKPGTGKLAARLASRRAAKSKRPPEGPITDEEKKARGRKEGASWLIAVACSVVLVIVLATVWGNHISVTHGGADPEDVAAIFLQSLEKKSRPTLETAFLMQDGMYRTTCDGLFAYIEKEDGIQSVDYGNVKLASTEASDENVRLIWDKTGVQAMEAKLLYFEVPIVRVKDGNTYDTTTAYYLTTYKAGGKWYLYDCVKDATYVNAGTGPDGETLDVSDAYGLFNNRFLGGDTEMGYIPLDDTWYAMDPADVNADGYQIEGAVKDLGYVQEQGGAAIHMVLLEVDEETSLEDLNKKLLSNLTADGEAAMSVESMESTLSNCPAWCTGAYIQMADLYFFSWLVDSREVDGYVRYLSFECVDGWQQAAGYVTSFVLPQHYYDRPSFDDEKLENKDVQDRVEIDSWSKAEEDG